MLWYVSIMHKRVIMQLFKAFNVQSTYSQNRLSLKTKRTGVDAKESSSLLSEEFLLESFLCFSRTSELLAPDCWCWPRGATHGSSQQRGSVSVWLPGPITGSGLWEENEKVEESYLTKPNQSVTVQWRFCCNNSFGNGNIGYFLELLAWGGVGLKMPWCAPSCPLCQAERKIQVSNIK